MNNDLGLAVRAKLALTTGSSLSSLVKAKKAERETFLLIDCSFSMNEPTEGYGVGAPRKIDALRSIVNQLASEGLTRTMVGFGISRQDGVGFIESIPEPSGGTPLAEAIHFAHANGGKHLVVISDGEPNNGEQALMKAQTFGGPIDVFYVGPAGGRGEQFLQQLAQTTKGKCNTISLTEPKQLASALRGLLGAKAA